MAGDTDRETSPLNRFIDQYRKDREGGAVRALRDYFDLFPGDEQGIAGEFLFLQRGSSAAPEKAAGRLGPYRILRELGRGGQATVYLAEDQNLGRQVALKVLEGLSSVQEEVLARFRREAMAASRLLHPGICAIYEANVDAGVPHIAMQYVEGETLARKIATTKDRLRPKDISEVFPVSEGGLGERVPEPAPATEVEPPDLARLARIALMKGQSLEAARWFAEAFARNPALSEDLGERYRYDAARAAARAAAVGANEWRKTSAAWMEAELSAWEGRLELGRVKEEELRERLEGWLREPAFATVRGDSIATLGEEDRQVWEDLWQRVSDLLRRL
jgi:hypothetical protein